MFSERIIANNLEIGKFNDSFWLKLFFHNCSGNVKFQDEREALHVNTEQKYSILGDINANMKTKGKYEFILEYPDNVYYQWRQSSNPIKEIEIEGKNEADGFEPIHQGSNQMNISGLVKTTIKIDNNYTNSFLNGEPGNGLWHFAVGMYKDTQPGFLNSDIPGYPNGVKYETLWVKIDPKTKYKYCTCNRSQRQSHSYLLFLVSLISY